MPETELLREILEAGSRLVRARYGALGVLNPRGDALARFITSGIGEEARAAIGPLPGGKGLLGTFIRDPRPLRLRDMREDPRSAGFPPGHPPMRSFLGFPLFSSGKVCGSLYFTEKLGPPEFRAADERLAENIARLAVQAIESPAAHPEVRRSLGFLRSAVEEGAGAVIITSPAPVREIILWNEGARGLFGYTEEEALGQRYADLLVPLEGREEWRRDVQPGLTRRLQEGKEACFEAPRLHKDGRRIRVGAAMSPIRHEVAGIMAITRVYRFKEI